MTKSRHSPQLLLWALFISAAGFQAWAGSTGDAYSCVRDLMPITAQANFQVDRRGIEHPFMVAEKFLVFPEVSRAGLTGFYVYSPEQAWYYDAIVLENRKIPLADLNATAEHTLYSLVAQPAGLETVTLSYLPGYGQQGTLKDGPVILGASVLPVVGALVSRDNRPLRAVYHNPDEVGDNEIKKWVYEHTSRKPANVNMVEIHRTIAHLYTRQVKPSEQLWAPLKEELRLRKRWVQNHNLDEDAFRRLSRIMESTCKNQ